MDQINWGVIIPVIIALIASAPAVLNFFRTRKRDKVEGIAIVTGAGESLAAAAATLLDPMRERIAELEERDAERDIREAELRIEFESMKKELARIDRNNFILCDGVRRLIHQIKSLGAEPVFEIDEELCEEMSNGGDISGEFDADRLT